MHLISIANLCLACQDKAVACSAAVMLCVNTLGIAVTDAELLFLARVLLANTVYWNVHAAARCLTSGLGPQTIFAAGR